MVSLKNVGEVLKWVTFLLLVASCSERPSSSKTKSPEPEEHSTVPGKSVSSTLAWATPPPPPRELVPGVPQTIPLPARLSRMMPSGGGRVLLLHFPSEKKVSLLDLYTLEWMGEYMLEAEDHCFVVGRRHVFLASGTLGRIQIIDLEDPQQNREISVEPFGHLREMVMGRNTLGPVYLFTTYERNQNYKKLTHVFDLISGRLEEYEGPKLTHSSSTFPPRVSDDGQFLVVNFNEPHTLYKGKWLPLRDMGDSAPAMSEHVKRQLFMGGGVKWSSISSLRPPYALHVYHAPRDQIYKPFVRTHMASIRVNGLHPPLWVIPMGDMPVTTRHEGGPAGVRHDDIIFSPDAHLFLHVDRERRNLLVYDVDLSAFFSSLQIPYLVVDSSPPTGAKAGETFRYPMVIRGNRPPYKFHLLAGPQHMEVHDHGELVWNVGKDAPEKTTVLVEVTDAEGQIAQHGFQLPITGGKTAFISELRMFPQHRDVPGKEGDRELLLPGLIKKMESGGAQKHVMVWMPEFPLLAIIDPVWQEIRATLTMVHADMSFALGDDDLIVADLRTDQLTHYDLVEGKRTKTVQSPVSLPLKAIYLAGGNSALLAVSVNDTFHLLDRKTLNLLSSDRQPEIPLRVKDNAKSARGYLPINPHWEKPLFGMGFNYTLYADADQPPEVTLIRNLLQGPHPLIPAWNGDVMMKGHMLLRNGGEGSSSSFQEKRFLLPAVGNVPYYLELETSFSKPDFGEPGRTFHRGWIHVYGNDTPVLSVFDLYPKVENADRPAEGIPPFRERFILHAESKSLVTLQPDLKTLRFRELNPVEALKASGLDYLYASPPLPRLLQADLPFEQHMAVHSSTPLHGVDLVQGPSGIQIEMTSDTTYRIWYEPTDAPPIGEQTLEYQLRTTNGLDRRLKTWMTFLPLPSPTSKPVTMSDHVENPAPDKPPKFEVYTPIR